MKRIAAGFFFLFSIAAYAELDCNDARYTYNESVRQVCNNINDSTNKARTDETEQFIKILSEADTSNGSPAGASSPIIPAGSAPFKAPPISNPGEPPVNNNIPSTSPAAPINPAPPSSSAAPNPGKYS